MESGKRGSARAFAIWSVASVGLAAVWAAPAPGGTNTSDTLGKSTLEQKIVPDETAGFNNLGLETTSSGYIVREEGIGSAQSGRDERRTSLLYFGQLSDFQLADEESPARVEVLDTGPFSSAWRTNDALLAHQADAMIQQINAFAPASPLEAGDGSRRAMDLTINTGDAADSMQKNEAEWVRTLAEGGSLTPGSGVDPATSGDPLCAALDAADLIADDDAPQNYTGVQDYDDYIEGTAQYYDPDQPLGPFAGWPSYPNLMNEGQAEFAAAGLDVPHYLTFGNHDALVQGNAFANAAYETVVTGCVKPLTPFVADPASFGDALADIAALDLTDVTNLLTSDPTKIALVPPDPNRRFVSKLEYKDVFRAGTQADGHGFDFVDPAEEAASNGAAGYYTWSPEPGIRFISVDTISEAGVIGPSADGNVDDPQFQWLTGQLEAAEVADELVVLFSHHAIPSLTADVPDELAAPCTADDAHGHDINPGCDLDPRDSAPIHLGADLTALLHDHPNVVAWVAGHSHQNTIDPYPNPSGDGGFWSIRVAAEADWPQQSRLLEIFDNEDGTLSIFGTILDHASPASAPAAGTDATTLDQLGLASIGRTIGYNDPQYGGESCNPTCEGDADDRNVELLVDDPREGGSADKCENLIEGTGDADELEGTPASDRIKANAGPDSVSALAGNDCVRGGRGADSLKAGPGDDRVNGGRQRDWIAGYSGEDRLTGGGGNDYIKSKDGEADLIRCGKGRKDRARGDELDLFISCERVKTPN
jgi:metallophosphoesterase (TIGR03767 family)